MIKKEVAQATSFFVRTLRLRSIEIKQKNSIFNTRAGKRQGKPRSTPDIARIVLSENLL
ncbi:hypothetical protein [Negativicoccus succinicivorans]|mgnify:CR=1 FL=1|uniref:hypothetical protein n=1 Tax=Negativicoccus succinicivorans TaxID=620903 RepID=UPI0029030075|nr:hypothetical protein [Negativicoccus succinicivorans]MDU1056184.1 hypothetical protein [Negativicoccus succinicivorans]MDU2643533.1 hypothetical protein [Negativicoccus succinicivorans]MDU4202911.1 hypothetical protein [Negativicoccus succinicivorans]MDU5232688.1 hypothetical protein [Negativicoccus succinicivorans]MDU5371924.1 hypothetical protein [Negativicoccus succinicivorans]